MPAMLQDLHPQHCTGAKLGTDRKPVVKMEPMHKFAKQKKFLASSNIGMLPLQQPAWSLKLIPPYRGQCFHTFSNKLMNGYSKHEPWNMHLGNDVLDYLSFIWLFNFRGADLEVMVS